MLLHQKLQQLLTRSTLFYLITCLLLILHSVSANAQTDTAAKKKKPEEHLGHMLRLGLDISRPLFNAAQTTHSSYEGELDYYIRKEVYATVEGGFGNSNYDYSDLSYKTSNSFFRAGIDKTIITRLGPGDWDAVFFGIRYAFAPISRGEANYTIVDSVWGNTSGTIDAKTFTAHWAEITGGVRVELLKSLFAGWNVRARFLLNGRSFQELSPAFIAGYGRGDKTTVFDFNFYLSYALRWGMKQNKD
jgi:hypothetical protein